MVYEVGPFPKVEVILAGDVVDSVVIHLAEPVAEADVLTELGLGSFAGVDILDDNGDILGRSVPERGVALSYSGDASQRQVSQVVLASISSEPFLLRATADKQQRYEQVLADATYALGIDAETPEPHAVCARVLLSL